MKRFLFLLTAATLLLLIFSNAGAEEAFQVIQNINKQMSSPLAQAHADLTFAGEVYKMDLVVTFSGGKEYITARISEPERRKGEVKLSWESGRVNIKHTETGRGKERLISVRSGDAFLSTGLSYVDIRFLQDTGNYEYRWLDGKIEALSRDPSITVYGKRILTLRKMEDSNWAITGVVFYDRDGRKEKEAAFEGYVKAFGGWRPSKITMKKETSRHITVLELNWQGGAK